MVLALVTAALRICSWRQLRHERITLPARTYMSASGLSSLQVLHLIVMIAPSPYRL
jgi:hypothetical protein